MILFPRSQNKRIEPESLRPQDHLTPVSCRNYEKFDDSLVFKPGYDENASAVVGPPLVDILWRDKQGKKTVRNH